MALQDLTPQLRTRLSRMERAVGWFVILATALLVFGFVYYVYQTAQSKGWFIPKFKYQTSLNNASGIKAGDPVKLMGFAVGQITQITPNEPDAYYGVTIGFAVLKPYYGYIWDDSAVKVSSDLFGNRFLEITKGLAGVATIDEGTNRVPRAMLRWDAVRRAREQVLAQTRAANPDLERTNRAAFNWFVMDSLKQRVRSDRPAFYTNLTSVYWIAPQETPALNERLEHVANQLEEALPNILNLTNPIATVLSRTATLTSNLNLVALDARPAVSNLALVTAQLNQPGALGDWLLPTNINRNLDATLATANTNLAALAESLSRSLDNLADITSNLNHQVQVNTNILGEISKVIVDSDTFVQGLKRHWLLRSAFKSETTNAPPAMPAHPLLPPKNRGQY